MSASERTVFRRSLGFVFQRLPLLPALTACDNVAVPVVPFKTRFDKRARARELLAAVGLEGKGPRPAGQAVGRSTAAGRHRPGPRR